VTRWVNAQGRERNRPQQKAKPQRKTCVHSVQTRGDFERFSLRFRGIQQHSQTKLETEPATRNQAHTAPARDEKTRITRLHGDVGCSMRTCLHELWARIAHFQQRACYNRQRPGPLVRRAATLGLTELYGDRFDPVVGTFPLSHAYVDF